MLQLLVLPRGTCGARRCPRTSGARGSGPPARSLGCWGGRGNREACKTVCQTMRLLWVNWETYQGVPNWASHGNRDYCNTQTSYTSKKRENNQNIFIKIDRQWGNFMSVTDVYHRFIFNEWESPNIQWLMSVTDAQFSEITLEREGSEITLLSRSLTNGQNTCDCCHRVFTAELQN